MELKTIPIENPEQLNFILGHSHFIKTVEDLYEAIVNTVPGAKFGLAFCEASDVCLVRYTGTDEELIDLARKNALNLGAGHSFIIFLCEHGQVFLSFFIELFKCYISVVHFLKEI